MENASKALIIAGSILVAILLIGLGLSFLISGSKLTGEASSNIDSKSVTMFNNQFLSFFSDSTLGASAKSLTSKIIQHNATTSTCNTEYINELKKNNTFSKDDHHIYLNFYPKGEASITHKWKSSDLQVIYSKISDLSKYKIYATQCTTYPGGYYNGYLICISIKEI